MIRDMIVSGRLADGARVPEASLAGMLGMSRTPVRQALLLLAHEGLLLEHATRGYVVRGVSRADIVDAIDLRGVIEGMAARRLAENGAPSHVIEELRQCLADGDRILARGCFDESDDSRYGDMNIQFHALIVRAARSPMIEQALARTVRLSKPDLTLEMLVYAQLQHHAILEALQQGQGARVEALMQEHTRVTEH